MTQDPFYEPPTPQPTNYGAVPEKSSNKTLLIVIIVIALLLLCCCCVGAGWFLWTYGDQILYGLGLSILPLL